MEKYTENEYITMQNTLHTEKAAGILRKSTVGIAGLGGLGSNAAVALARAGLGKLVLVDFDVVEFSNLNRQVYTLDDIGTLKTDALAGKIRAVNPYVELELITRKITSENCSSFFKGVDVVIEAVDVAAVKGVIIESILTEIDEIPVVAASGIAGYGRNDKMAERRIGRLVLIGDEETEVSEGVPLFSPRVIMAAGMQANAALDLILNRRLK
ncbi:MAG: sulfur carrier protein ThiS adenylyltransferase ThiF [Spirochaetes bacterium]|nr:MAG: sulfur carrier protein ThiS adenylyltransferase ThiF [Spirochaetota bacterium]